MLMAKSPNLIVSRESRLRRATQQTSVDGGRVQGPMLALANHQANQIFSIATAAPAMIGGECCLQLREATQETKSFQDTPDHHGEVGVLVLAEQTTKIIEVIVTAIFNTLPESAEVEAGTARDPQFVDRKGPCQIPIEWPHRDLRQVVKVTKFRALTRCADLFRHGFL